MKKLNNKQKEIPDISESRNKKISPDKVTSKKRKSELPTIINHLENFPHKPKAKYSKLESMSNDLVGKKTGKNKTKSNSTESELRRPMQKYHDKRILRKGCEERYLKKKKTLSEQL